MATAKRLYLYTVSAVGLGLLLWALYALLDLGLNHVGMGPMGSSIPADISNGERDTISLAIAALVVGLPLWLIHWILVERMVLGPTEQGSAERASIVRSIYFAGVLAASLYVAAIMWIATLSVAIADAIGARNQCRSCGADYVSSVDYALQISAALLATVVWMYHAYVRGRDVRKGIFIPGAAAWISRFYLYGAALAGIVYALANAASLIGLLMFQLTGRTAAIYDTWTEPGSPPWWVRPTIAMLVAAVFWGAIWLAHRLYSNRLVHGLSPQSGAERASRVRLAFFALVVFYGVYTVASGLIYGLDQMVAWIAKAANLAHPDLYDPGWYYIFEPLVVVIPAAVAWWWHRRRGIAESLNGPAGVSGRRIASYATALVGIYALALGAGVLIYTLLQQIVDPESLAHEVGTMMVAAGIAYLVTGLLLWVWPWFSSQHRRRFEGPAETESSSRGYYLYLIAAASVIAVATAVAMIVYRLARNVLGLPETDLKSEMILPSAVLIVGTVLFAYHAFVLRSRVTPWMGMAGAPFPGAPFPGAPFPGAPFPGAPMAAPGGPVPAWPVPPAPPPAPAAAGAATGAEPAPPAKKPAKPAAPPSEPPAAEPPAAPKTK